MIDTGTCYPKLLKRYIGTCYPKLLKNKMLNIGTRYPKLLINEMLDIGIRYPKLLKNERHDWYVMRLTDTHLDTTMAHAQRLWYVMGYPHVDTTMKRDWCVISDTIYDHDTYKKTLVRNGVIPM